jgi:N-formylglutamate amidohydrolase
VSGLTENLFFDIPLSTLFEPLQITCPLVFNSPHSGRFYPLEFLNQTRLDAQLIRKSEDTHVDDMFAPVLNVGAVLHVANFPRSYVDVNREAFELDQRMFDELLPSYIKMNSSRALGEFGTIARMVSEAVEIYDKKLSLKEAFHRIETVYKPFHRSLRLVLKETHDLFGKVVLVDCHSMPSTTHYDIVLGDQFGKSANKDLSDYAYRCLRDLGFSVAKNNPYAGGYITQFYGKPLANYHALQIEINRALYMNEKTRVLTHRFNKVQAAMEQFAINLKDYLSKTNQHTN